MSIRDWIPSVDDVGAVIRSRTKSAGIELGTFTDDTRPTRVEVQPLIDTVTSRISAKCGKIPDDIQAFARRVAAIGVAADVELSYWPEQVSSGNSPYEQLKALFDEGFAELFTASQNDDGDEDTGGGETLASHSYGIDCAPITLESVW